MISCWYCSRETNIKDDDYGDHNCNLCGVMISVYDPKEFINQEPEQEEEMKPPVHKTEYEKVKVGEFICGVIDDIEYEEEHKFTFKGQEKTSSAVRLVFKLDGYVYPHRSRWMYFSYGEKTNLYKKYIAKLVEGAKPDMDFELDNLKGMRIKTIWEENNDFQNIESIFPEDKKIISINSIPDEENAEDAE